MLSRWGSLGPTFASGVTSIVGPPRFLGFKFLSSRHYSNGSSESSSPLIQDPLSLPNLKRIRDASSEFEIPYLVSLDAFNTLYHPKVPVFQSYHEVSSSLGLTKSAAEIEQAFPAVFVELQQKWPNFGKDSGLNSDLWWKELIVRVFQVEHYNDSASSAELCERLMARFGTGAYQVHEDVVPALEKLRERGVKLVASSNSDERVHGILEELNLSQYFDAVVLSYDVGYTKPSRHFFDAVLSQSFPGSSKSSLLERCWHVGDNYQADFIGSIKSGWNGVLLDRNGTSEFFRNKNISQLPESECFMEQQQFELKNSVKNNDSLVILADNRVAMESLSQLQTLFQL